MWSTRFGCQGIIASVIALAVFLGVAPADEGREVYKKTLRGVALVLVSGGGQGSGWVVDKANKLVVTNYHVVENAEVVKVIFPVYPDDKARQNGRPLSSREEYKDRLGLLGRVLDSDTDRDLAVIQLENLPEGTEALKLADDSASPGDRVHTVGNPAASDGLWVHSDGSVRQVYKKRWSYRIGNRSMPFNAWVLETQAPTNPGDSGGPIVDSNGEVVAVVSGSRLFDTSGGQAEAMRWGIDVREVKDFVNQSRRLLRPGSAADYALRGERALKRGRLPQAQEDCNKALELDANCAAAYRSRGRLLQSKGDLDTAIADLNRAVELNGRDAVAYFQRGFTFFKKGKGHWDKAVEDYTRAIQIDPKHALAYNNRGFIHEGRNELQQAFADYNHAIDKDPFLTTAFDNRGDIYRKQGEYKKALADYGESIRKGPAPYAVQQAALTCLDLGDPKQAIALANLLIKEFRVGTALPHQILGRAHSDLHDYRSAAAGFSEAIKRNPNDAETYARRGEAYDKLGDARAAADFDKAARLDPKWAAKLKAARRPSTSETREPPQLTSKEVRDRAKYFTPDAVRQASAIIRSVRVDHGVEVLVETFRTTPPDRPYDNEQRQQYFASWAKERRTAEKVNGIYVLICRQPGYIQFSFGPALSAKTFPNEDRNQLRTAVVARFKEKRFDDALLEGVKLIQNTVGENQPKAGAKR